MSTWKIYRTVSGAAQEIAECVSLEFHDTWMGEEFVTVSITSPTPIELQVGDYLTYRGATYTIYSLPTALKTARINSYGEAFKYDGVKLSARSTELTDIRFLDIVLGDNNLHYTSLPTFSVYCQTVDDLVDRLQANTDRNGIQWFFITPSYSRTMQRYTGTAAVTAEALWHQYYDNADNPSQGNTEINISVDKMSVWDGLAFIKNNFGLNFITRDRACIVGAPGVIADHIFRYGKGNGLYEIERTADTDQQIVTKLFAYGSDKNLPLRYYATIGDDMPNNMAVNVLMLPGFPEFSLSQLCRTTYYTDGTGSRHTKVQIRKTPSASYSDIMDILGEYTIGFSTDKLRPYITSGNVDTLGVKEGDIHFTEENDDNGLQEVYPSIEGMTAGDAGVSGLPADERLDEIVSISNLDGTKAYIDDNGVFEEGAEIPNFCIYLKPLGFNLKEAYDNNGGSMVIHLNDGYCGGRDFAVKGVTAYGDGWKLNVERHHDESLDLYFPYSWAAATGGTPSANEAYQIRQGDHFVLTEIEISDTSYIWAASVKALRKAVTWLLNNDYTRFTYLPKVDEIFMAREHDSATAGTSLHDTLKAGDVMTFEDTDLNVSGNVFIDSLTIKENGNNGIPTYDVVLRNDKQVTTLQRIQNQLNSLSSFVAGGGGGLTVSQIRQLINTYGAELFLSKLNDDTAQGFIRMLKGIQVGALFTPDILGEGGVFRMNADGKVELVTDILYTRVKAYFDNVEIRDYQHTSGNRIASQAQGFKCSRVEWYDSNNQVLEQTVANRSSVAYFRCYWRVDDGQKKTDNQFIIGDLAFCQSAEVTNDSLVTNRFWRLVIGRNDGTTTTEDGEAWVDLSNAHNANGTPKMTTITWIGQGGTSQSMQALSFEAGSGIPTAEDDICQLGNVRDNTRQGAIIEYVSSIDSPTYQIYQDIGSDATNPYSLNNKNYIGLGYNTATGRAYMNVYGDMYIGAKPDPQTGVSPTYIEYKQDDGTQYHRPSLKIKANVEFTNPDSELDSFVQEHQNNYDDSWIQPALDAIQEQIDGELDTWYYAGVPTLNNAPANTWTTDDDKKKHVGDLYYDKSTGFVYRFLYDDENESYYWTQIHDDAISQALRIANQAQDTADNKRRVFICDSSHHTPTPPYDEGDLWVNVKYPWATGATYNNEILKCIKPVPRTEGGQDITTFDIDDWSVANGYTAALKNFVDNTYAPFVTNIQGQVDGKAETWRQATNPANSWSTDTEKANHVGDLWMDTSSNGGNKTYIYVDNGESASIRYAWVAQEVPDAVFDEIDGKADIFVSKPTAYNANDMWIIEEGATNLPTDCVAGDIVIADNMPSGTKKRTSYNKSDWRKKDRYTDDTKIDSLLANQYVTQLTQGTLSDAISTAQGTADAAAAAAASLGYLSQALTQDTQIVGGLVLSSLIGLRDGNGTLWSGISGTYMSSETGTGYKGHGIAAWYGGGQIDHEVSPSATNYAKSLFRFDGSGYLAGGNITWDKNGIVTIANVYSDVNGTPVPWSGSTLQYINNISTLLPTTVQSGTTYLDPQVSFWNLSVKGQSVATEQWVSQNYISVAFFNRLFQARNGNSVVTANDTATVIDSIKAMVGLWTQQYISALGQNAQGGGGGGGGVTRLDALSDVAISDPTNGQVLKYNSSTGKWYNGTDSGVTSVAWSAITGKPSTISGYGISDAYISGGTITIGSNSITPTDTKNTAGSTNTSSKIFLIGATSQAANPQTYSHDTAYVGTDGCLYSDGTKVLTAHQSLSNYVTLNSAQTISATKTFSVQQAFTVAQGTAPFTVTSTTKVTNLNADYLDGLSSASFARRVTINITNDAYRRHVVALCKLTANNVEGDSYSVGRITNVRMTGVNTPRFADVYFSAEYAGNYTLYCSLYSNFRNKGTSSVSGSGYRPCKFKYNDEWYGGVELYLSAATPYTMAFVGETNFSIFGVAYYDTQNSSPLNSEIYNSLNYTDIDETSTLYANTFSGNATSATSATSATKLQTARTLWGQSFDGSGNVDGKMTINYDNSTAAELITLDAPNATYNCISYKKPSGGSYNWSVGISKDHYYFYNSKMAGKVAVIDNDGNVGIGTTTPTNKLDVNGTIGLPNSTSINMQDANGTDREVMSISAYNSLVIGGGSRAVGSTYILGTNIRFRYGASGEDDGMILNSSGNVGVGTDAPSYKFDVYSTATNTWSARIMGEQTVDSTTSRASVYLAQSWGNGMWVGVSSTTNDGYIATFQRGITTTGSGGNAAMQIRADGSVCIGVFAATCSTAIGTKAKTATINGYTLVSGRVVRITFTNGNSVTAPTLNISSTGAKTIRQADNTALTSTTIAAGDVVDLQYDGTYYKIVGINQHLGEDYSLWVNSTIKATNSIRVSKPTSAASAIYVQNINRNISLLVSSNAGIYDHTTTSWIIAKNKAGNGIFIPEGNVGIGVAVNETTAPSYKLHVAGDIYATGAVSCLSDERFKDIKGETALSVEQIAKMPSIKYTWKDGREDKDVHVGSIAQRWMTILPEVVMRAKDENGTLSINYGVAAMIASITTARKVVDHERRIKELEKENMRLRTEVEQLIMKRA